MKYDVVVIGGGPAGLMAALSAAELGRKVVLIEKNKNLGVKLLLTGGGRCNLTNNIPDYHLLAASFGPSGRFLITTVSRFGVLETLDFFQNRGLKIKIEKDNQVFPQSDRASDVLNILVTSFEKASGEILKGCPVQKIIKKGQRIEKIILNDGSEIVALNYIIATGGLAYPATGSTGDGYSWLKSLGHTIKSLFPALTPLLAKEKLVKDLEGLSLATVRLSLFNAGRKIAETFGPIIFTATGLSGPAALNLSRHFYSQGAFSFQLEIDFVPQYSQESLNNYLKEKLFRSKKFLKNSLESLVPGRLAEKILILTNLDQKQLANSLSQLERKKLVSLLKKMSLTVGVSSDYERALVTGGGLDLKELDSRTLHSKMIANLFVVGEILDLTGPSGGYNLQLAWSTGRVAGEAAALKDL